tara:strand:+ start:99 stop:977 length:879 start_codon:yes stop_codon:yes gene_type:complete
MLAVENPLLRAPIRITDDYILRDKSKACNELDATKELVPEIKKNIDDKKWKTLTEPIINKKNKPVCSKAFYKMEEIIQSCVLPPPKTSFHICEAPGGFVQAVNDQYDTLEKWYATSISDGIQFKTDLLDLKKGEILKPDLKGDILEKSVRDSFDMKVDLVTADGAFLDEDHNSIEQTNYVLLASETDIALKCLNPGGIFVCKFFEGMETRTQILIALLTNCFENVSIIKPKSSKITNSERYIVCRGFEKYLDVIDTVWTANEEWMDDLQEILDEYCVEQNNALKSLIKKIGK